MALKMSNQTPSISFVLVVGLINIWTCAYAGEPPPVDRPVPSAGKVALDSRWVAPFVEYTAIRGDRWQESGARCFSTDGTLLVEMDGLMSVPPRFGHYFTSLSHGKLRFHGMYGDWLLDNPGAETYGVASTDGRVFIQFVREHRSAVGIAVYVTGKRTVQIGPFEGMHLEYHAIGFDGSVAALFSTGKGTDSSLVVLSDEKGKIRLHESMPGTVTGVKPAPSGRGVLVWYADSGLEYISDSGTTRSIEIDPALSISTWFAVWIPESSKVILGSQERLAHVLVDCELGQVMWAVGFPGPNVLLPERVAAFGDYVFQCGLERDQDTRSWGVRVIRALDLKTGRRVATWRSTPSPSFVPGTAVGQLMERSDHLYYLTDNAFSELRTEDVANAGEGCCEWEPVDSLNHEDN
jgi:hypothetical protein